MVFKALEDRFFTIFVACWTYLMGRFGAACLWLQHVSEDARSDFGKLIPLLLSIPCFKASNLCFQAAYSIQQRKLVRLGRKCVRLGGHDESLQFDDCLIKLREVANRPE